MNSYDEGGLNLIRRHVKTKNLKLIKLLLERGGDPNCSGRVGNTAIFRAVFDNQIELVK